MHGELIDRDIKVAIWANPRKNGKGMRYAAPAPVSSYKDAADNWLNTSYFSFEECLRASCLIL